MFDYFKFESYIIISPPNYEYFFGFVNIMVLLVIIQIAFDHPKSERKKNIHKQKKEFEFKKIFKIL